MLIKKLTKHGNSLALVIDKPLLDLLHIGPETEVELTIVNNGLTVRAVDEATHQRQFKEAVDELHERYGEVFKRLAE